MRTNRITMTAWLVGAALKCTPFEGFHSGLGQLPDLALLVWTQALVGSPVIGASVHGLDAVISKPLAIWNVASLSPYVSLGPLWIRTPETLVDLTPDTDAWASCVPLPAQFPGAPPNCIADGSDHSNLQRFAGFTAARWRTAIGIHARYRMLTGSGAVQWDLRQPSADADVPPGVSRQWSAGLALGLRY